MEVCCAITGRVSFDDSETFSLIDASNRAVCPLSGWCVLCAMAASRSNACLTLVVVACVVGCWLNSTSLSKWCAGLALTGLNWRHQYELAQQHHTDSEF